jgi:hypothetical protein
MLLVSLGTRNAVDKLIPALDGNAVVRASRGDFTCGDVSPYT